MNVKAAVTTALAVLSLTTAPQAAAADLGDLPQPGSQPAGAILDDLQALGYTVSINWTNNGMGVPLSRCQVTGYHAPGESTTIHMDVVCPDED